MSELQTLKYGNGTSLFQSIESIMMAETNGTAVSSPMLSISITTNKKCKEE